MLATGFVCKIAFLQPREIFCINVAASLGSNGRAPPPVCPHPSGIYTPEIRTICLYSGLKNQQIEFYLLNCKYVMKFKKTASSSSVQLVSKLQSFVCQKLFLYVFFTINMCDRCLLSDSDCNAGDDFTNLHYK